MQTPISDELLEGCSGGSGGDSGMDDDGNRLQIADCTHQISGNQVVLMSRKIPPTDPDRKVGPSSITLLAAGDLPTFGGDGKVNIRGCKGVRITSGAAAIPMLNPPVSSDDTNGVEVIVPANQKVTIQRGLTPVLSQKIEMNSSGIVVDGGIGEIKLKTGLSSIDMTMLGITLKVGLSQITLGPLGVTIQGPLIQIN